MVRGPAFVSRFWIRRGRRAGGLRASGSAGGLLSRFREDSEISALARLSAGERYTLHEDTADCLRQALAAHALTGGAFDPALGGKPGTPRGRLTLDPTGRTVTCVEPPVCLDLGAIGKGFALDCQERLLRDWDFEAGLLIAGGSSLLAFGEPSEPWEIGLTAQAQLLLRRGAVGCSGLTVQGAHVLDPRTGQPGETAFRAWIWSTSAAEADALSTAAMLLPDEDLQELCRLRPDLGGAQLRQPDERSLWRFGQGLGVSHAWRWATPQS